MYEILTIRDKIRIPPEKLGKKLREALLESISEKYEGVINKKLGASLMVMGIDEIGEGKIYPTDPGVYYDTTFKLLVYKPELHEVVEGEVVDAVEFGAFVNIGAFDGLVHISQLMDDYVSFDKKNQMFIGRQTRKTLKVGDLVRARIISVSWAEQNKIGLTMRQPGLGSLTWIEEEKKKKKKKGGK